MNPKPFRFRYVNELAGAFVLAAVALLVVGVIAAGRAQRWFEPRQSFRLAFPPEGTLGVQRGTRIQIMGNVVGSVQQIIVTDDGRIEGRAAIRGDFVRFVREDTVALVRKQFNVAGDAFVDLSGGTGAVLRAENAVLPCRKDTELLEFVQTLVEEVRARVLPLLDEVQKTLVTYRGLGEDLRAPEGPVMKSVGHASAILARLDAGEGTVGQLLSDPAIANETRRLLEQVNTLLAEVRESKKKVDAILDDVKQTTAHLPGMTAQASGVVSAELRDVPGAVLQARSALHEAEQVLVGLQNHWLLRGYVPHAQPLEPLAPEAVRPAPEVFP